MRNLLYIFLISFILAFDAAAQSPSSIKLRCPSPFSSIYGQVFVTAGGDIFYKPCPADSSVFYYNVDFSNATVTGLPFTASPLTTKGDLWGFSTLNARVPVGADGFVLTADNTVPLGLKWAALPAAGVTGTGTTNFIPRWTNGAGGVIGNTPFSWNGTQYVFSNTALTATWVHNFTPAIGAGGNFIVGNSVNKPLGFLGITETGNTELWGASDLRLFSQGSAVQLEAITGDVNIIAATHVDISAPTGFINFGSNGEINNAASTAFYGSINSGTGLRLDWTALIAKLGDPLSNAQGVNLIVDNTARTIQANTNTGIFSAGDTGGAGNATTITLDDLTKTTTLQNGAGIIHANTPGGMFTAGDFASAGNSTLFTVDDVNKIFNFSILTLDGLFDLDNILNYALLRTITAGGTTGAQVIDKPAGTVNFAGGASNLTVTNSTVTATSIINITARTNDATCYVKNYVPGAGSFVINMVAACTAETSVGFIVTN